MRILLLMLVILGAQSTRKEGEPQIYSLHVQSDIRYRYAHTLVTSRVANPANISREVTFTVVLPETAFISLFVIEDDKGIYKAYVREKEEAKKQYSNAVKKGETAGHVSLSTRDSNKFTVSVNLEPRKKVTFNLTYEELLTRKLGVYKHVINLDPGQIILDLSVQVSVLESSRISYLEVPVFKVGNEVYEDPMLAGRDPLARIHRSNPYSAVVRWAPSPEEQREMAASGVSGRLIVKYDVDREQHPQQILVNDGYFVHFFSPPDLPPLQKHVTFVLDTSDSMSGRKLRQLKQAMDKILSDLEPTDFFSIIKFASKAKVWNSMNSFTKLSKNNPEYNPVISATSDKIARAKLVIDELDANGATNIYKAMKTALQITKLGKKQWRVHKLNAGSRQQHRHPEPMIIFLTDGEPTEGKTDTSKIVTATTNRNKKSKAAIFCLALGSGADMSFLKKLSLRNFGFARKIYEASDTALQLTDFYTEVASPLLANVTFKYTPVQVEPVSLTQKQFYFFYSGSELVVSGRLSAVTPGQQLEYEVKGRSPDGLVKFEPQEPPVIIDYEPLEEDTPIGSMEKLWAYLSIQQLLDLADKKNGKRAALTKQALELALKYSFVTPVTSFVVVKPDGTHSQVEAVDNDNHSDVVDGDPTICSSSEHDLDPHSFPGNFDSDVEDPDYQHVFPRTPDAAYIPFAWDESAPSLIGSGSLRGPVSTLVYFEDIDWLGAFTVETKILLPFGANSSVSVLGPSINKTQQLQAGKECKTPEGEIGFCKHLRICPLNVFKQNFTAFLEFFCVIENRYAGSCCPFRLIPTANRKSLFSIWQN